MGKIAHNRKDITGKKFGKLTALKISGWYRNGDRRKEAKWLCKCDCGNTKKVLLGNLTGGKTKSCGCMQGGCVYSDPKIKSIVNVMNAYKSGARSRGHKFKLSQSDFIRLVTGDCFYCGAAPNTSVNLYLNKDGSFRARNISKARAEKSTAKINGIDRKNNDLGYVLDNVVPCCKTCNYGKHTMNSTEYENWLACAYYHRFLGEK